jgi:rod shape-determining protein MreD
MVLAVMTKHRVLEIALVVFVLLIGLLWRLLELPEEFDCYKPDFLLLGVFFVMLYLPGKIKIWTAWFVGLVADSMQGFVLGNVAIQMAFVALVVYIFHTRIVFYMIVQQSMVVMFLGLVGALTNMLLYNMVYQETNFCFLYPVILTAAVWPFYYLLFSGIYNMIYRR